MEKNSETMTLCAILCLIKVMTFSCNTTKKKKLWPIISIVISPVIFWMCFRRWWQSPYLCAPVTLKMPHWRQTSLTQPCQPSAASAQLFPTSTRAWFKGIIPLGTLPSCGLNPIQFLPLLYLFLSLDYEIKFLLTNIKKNTKKYKKKIPHTGDTNSLDRCG